MIDPRQFRELIVRPTLQALQLHSDAAENLVWGTAVHESRLTWLKQNGGGPALGLYQIEPATHKDLYVNYLAYRGDMANRLRQFLAPGQDRDQQLITNMAYATAVCRLIYFRAPGVLPTPDNLTALASIYKTVFNGPGKATTDEWIQHYKEAMGN